MNHPTTLKGGKKITISHSEKELFVILLEKFIKQNKEEEKKADKHGAVLHWTRMMLVFFAKDTLKRIKHL